MKMRITALTKFKHEYGTYEEGESYRVPRKLAWYFIALGWARRGGK